MSPFTILLLCLCATYSLQVTCEFTSCKCEWLEGIPVMKQNMHYILLAWFLLSFSCAFLQNIFKYFLLCYLLVNSWNVHQRLEMFLLKGLEMFPCSTNPIFARSPSQNCLNVWPQFQFKENFRNDCFVLSDLKQT